MGYVIKFNWVSSGATNANAHVKGYIDNTAASDITTIFEDWVYAANNNYMHSLPTYAFLDNTAGSGKGPVKFDFSCGPSLLNGDTGTVYVYMERQEIIDQLWQQTYLSTQHSVTVSDRTSILETSNQVFIDRTEYFTGEGSLMFWDASDISEVSDTTNIQYIFDKEPALTYGIYPVQTSGKLHIQRQAPIIYGGINGQIHIDVTALAGYSGNDMSVYVDYTSGSVGPSYLGRLRFTNASSNRLRKTFRIPDDQMLEIADASFAGAEMYLVNPGSATATWGLMDSYLTFNATQRAELDTSNSVEVADATTPIIWDSLTTSHKVHIKRGRVYIIDYYTPGAWWSFTNTDIYTYVDWNYYETILQYFARFFHSPLYYNNQLPDYGTIKLVANSSGTFTILEDYQGAGRSTSIAKRTESSGPTVSYGISLMPWIGNLLHIYSPAITPEIFVDDGTTYKLDILEKDNTIGIMYRYDSGGLYTYWQGDRLHPFASDHSFYISFYGKKE